MRTGLFQRLEPRAASALMKQLESVDFGAGDLVFAQGDPGDRLFIIVSGKVKFSYRCPHGQNHLMTVMGPSDMFGEVSIFDPRGRMFSAISVTEVRALSLSRDTIQALIIDHPEMVDQLLRVFARRLAQVTNVLTDSIHTDVPVLVARRLLQLAQQFGRREDDAVRVIHNLTAQEIEQLVGVYAGSVDGVLRDFVDRGWIRLEDASLVILDAEALAALRYREPRCQEG
jgi:CRP/FNR family cyclic AMP-dependent transcriptional regulator